MDIPENITELFKKYTELMLGLWNRSKTVGQQLESPVKDMLLCRIAYEMHAERLTSISIAKGSIGVPRRSIVRIQMELEIEWTSRQGAV